MADFLKDLLENDFRRKILKIVRFTPTVLRFAPFLAFEMKRLGSPSGTSRLRGAFLSLEASDESRSI